MQDFQERIYEENIVEVRVHESFLAFFIPTVLEGGRARGAVRSFANKKLSQTFCQQKTLTHFRYANRPAALLQSPLAAAFLDRFSVHTQCVGM